MGGPTSREFPGFGGRGGFGRKPALLLVDLTRGFTEPGTRLSCDVEDVVDANRRLLDAARAGAIPVVYTAVVLGEVERDAATHFLRKMPALEDLSGRPELSEIDPRLAPWSGEAVVPKIFPSAFFGTPVASILARHGVDTLIVTGVSTSGCVRATVVDALQHGFAPVIPREAVGDRDAAAHDANLHDLELKYADVVPTGDVLAYLQEVS